jgi:hypothetical protein
MITPDWHKSQGNAQNPHSLVEKIQHQQVFSPGLGHRLNKTAESFIQQGLSVCVVEQPGRLVKWLILGQLAQGPAPTEGEQP